MYFLTSVINTHWKTENLINKKRKNIENSFIYSFIGDDKKHPKSKYVKFHVTKNMNEFKLPRRFSK